jgi:hypothetical protein
MTGAGELDEGRGIAVISHKPAVGGADPGTMFHVKH